ncbi:hypothetical protein ACNSOL_12250 (plasmid) [Aliarcobacter lanthieri]|uniref:hypothetical protein n=1 Tax=Aliarcobacter lanthieri TaxID=1355374 RepID=UPI003AAE01D4
MSKMCGLRILKKSKVTFEINYKTFFSKDEKDLIKDYVEKILFTEYKGKCLNVEKNNNLILFSAPKNLKITEVYFSEIKISCMYY